MLLATAAKRRPGHKRRPRHTRTGIPLPRSDGRTIAARRFCELVESFEKELGGGLSEVEQSLVRQAANLVQVSERLQADVIAGVQVDTDAMVRISSEARRILGMLRAKATKNRAAGQDPLAAHIAAKYGHQSNASRRVDTEDDADEIAAVAE
jgi:hypothetical protein